MAEKAMKINWIMLCCILLVFSVACNGQPPVAMENEGSAMKKESEFLTTEWHRKKWQESPAIIDISSDEMRLLFNRPDKLFQLRRAQFFKAEELFEYSDDKIHVIYRIDRLEPPNAYISFDCRSQEGTNATGSFIIEARGE